MNNKSIRYYEFGEFRLDARRRVLYKNGAQTPLSTRICDLLLMMVQNEGEILEHDQILDQVWEGTFVEQSNLKKNISSLRQILGEQPNESLYIKTIPRRGYSFIAPVRAIEEDSQEDSSGAFVLQQTDTEIIIEEEIIEDDESLPIDVPSRLLTSKPQSFFRRHAVVLGIGLLGIAVAIFAAARFLGSSRQISFSADNVRITKLTNTGKISISDISRDGNYLVYSTRDREGLSTLWVKQVAAESANRIVAPQNSAFYSYGFSHDGNYVFYTVENFDDPKLSGLYKIPTLGGTPVRVLENALIKDFTVDGKQVIVVKQLPERKAAIEVADLNGDHERQIALFDNPYRIWDVRASPDKTNLLVSLRRQYDNKVTFRVAEVPLSATPENAVLRDIIPEQERAIRSAVWVPDKSSVLLSIRETNAEIVQLWQYFPGSNDWRRITNDNNFYTGISLLPDGKSFVTGQGIGLATIAISENNADELKQVGAGTGQYLDALWTPDGRILYSSLENQQETISTMDADGGNVQKLTLGNDGIRLYPSISANGKFVSFVSSRTGTMQIWRMDSDGKNLVQMTNLTEQLYDGQVLSDGKTVVYAAFKSNGWVLVKQTADGRTIPLTTSETDELDISPDEKTFASFVTNAKTGKSELTLGSIEDGSVVKTFDVLPRGTPILRFTPDGKNLAYIVTKNDVSNIYTQAIDGGPEKQLTNFKANKIRYFDWSRDGKTLLVIHTTNFNDAVMFKALSEADGK